MTAVVSGGPLEHNNAYFDARQCPELSVRKGGGCGPMS